MTEKALKFIENKIKKIREDLKANKAEIERLKKKRIKISENILRLRSEIMDLVKLRKVDAADAEKLSNLKALYQDENLALERSTRDLKLAGKHSRQLKQSLNRCYGIEKAIIHNHKMQKLYELIGVALYQMTPIDTKNTKKIIDSVTSEGLWNITPESPLQMERYIRRFNDSLELQE